MALTPEQIGRISRTYGESSIQGFDHILAFAQAIEAEVRKSDEALIRQLVDAADPLQGAANWLAEAHGQFSPVVLSGCLMIGYNRAKRLHDAALAARKQGANHD